MTASLTKSALVTGASGGIGRAVAKRLAQDGFDVAVHYAGNPDKANAVAAEIRTAGVKAVTVQADIANATDVERLFQETLAAFGTLDVVVNSAGICRCCPFQVATSQASTR